MPRSDKLFFYSLLPSAAILVAAFLLLLKILVENSIPILAREGLDFILTSTWRPSETSPEAETYGILAPLLGTIYTSVLAVALALPASIALTVFTVEYVPRRLQPLVSSIVEVMAGLPTVLYGLWGAYVLAPLLRDHVMNPLSETLWFIPLFSCKPVSPATIFTASIVLAVMVTPFTASVIREAYEAIPHSYREAALGLGATKAEYTRIMLSMIKPAMLAAALLGLGRAAGETIAVSMTIGNSFNPPTCLFQPGYTISSLIANQFPNANFYHYMASALYAAGLTLLAIGAALNAIGVYLLARWRRSLEA